MPEKIIKWTDKLFFFLVFVVSDEKPLYKSYVLLDMHTTVYDEELFITSSIS